MELHDHTGWDEKKIRRKLHQLDLTGKLVRVQKSATNLAGVAITKTAYKVTE